MGCVAAAGVFVFCAAEAALVCSQEYATPGGNSNVVMVCVHTSVYPALLEPHLRQYIADLESERYAVKLVRFTSGTAQELKDYFAQQLPALKGVVMVGTLPYATYEIQDDFKDEEFEGYGYASFPSDLFFMQTRTPWVDNDGNGLYDAVSVGLENAPVSIWIGRMMPAALDHPEMDEVAFLKNYFQKNHFYRTAGYEIAHRALNYVDDDWAALDEEPGYGAQFLNPLPLAYTDVTLLKAPQETCAADYRARLAEGFEWIQVWVHSSESLHHFKVNGDWEEDSIPYSHVRDNNPRSLFYNLFACSNANYAAHNNMGGHYAFARENGLAAIGSTKTGSMLYGEYFYRPLGQEARVCLGEGFRYWFQVMNENMETASHTSWHFGMTIIGDPTLRIDPPRARIDEIDAQDPAVSFAGSGTVGAGIITGFRWRSDKDGVLSDQPSFSSSTLSPGEHRIYLQAQDSLGRWSSEVSATVTVNGGGIVYGDVSGDGKISAYDAALTARHAVGLQALSAEEIVRADVTGDGRVTTYDAALIAQRSLGLIDRFPVETP